MDHIRNGSRRSATADILSGTVWYEEIYKAKPPGRVWTAKVRFEPASRTAWHTHPFGQTLYVIEGLGLAQSKGGPVTIIRPGDTIWFDAGENHWHGAMPDIAMTHLAIYETLDGKGSEQLGKLTEEEYQAAARAAI